MLELRESAAYAARCVGEKRQARKIERAVLLAIKVLEVRETRGESTKE